MARLLLVIALVACGHDHGPPRVQKLPHADGVSALRGNAAPKSKRVASYVLDARLDAERHRIEGTEKLTWTNTGTTAVDMLPFHLYLNAFKNEASLFMQGSRGMMRGARASETGWGWIQIDSIVISGVDLQPKLRFPNEPDETVVELPLATPIEPDTTVEIQIKFTVQLPEVFARTGYKGEFHMVGQWFPKIGVRLGDRWECKPFYATTEFFADFGTYDVTLTVPSTYVVAATGVLVGSEDQPGGTHKLVYHAEDVHDFAWMADPYMKVIEGKADVGDGEVAVRVYARAEQADFAARHLQAAIGALERFSADFLPYPWPIFTVIDPPMDAQAGAGGMEYPTLVTTEGDSVFSRPGIHVPEYVTIHETGHQWFQGMLASNEPEEAWLDEGVNEWADAHVMTDLYGPRHGIDWQGWQADLSDLIAAARLDPDSPSPIATPAYRFVDIRAWAEQTYTGTQRALATLEQYVGPTVMMKAMKDYANAWSFRHPTGADLFALLQQSTGKDLQWYVAPAFQQVGGLQLAVRTSTCWLAHRLRGIFDLPNKPHTLVETPNSGSWVCEVIVENTGVVRMPVDLELKFADGSSERERWDDRGGTPAWHKFTIERSAPLVEVVLDPENKILLGSPVGRARRLEGDGSASLRAAARIASWAQELMQVVGP